MHGNDLNSLPALQIGLFTGSTKSVCEIVTVANIFFVKTAVIRTQMFLEYRTLVHIYGWF